MVVPPHEWVRERELFRILRKFTYFGKHSMVKCFVQWREGFRSARYKRRQAFLRANLPYIHPCLAPAWARVTKALGPIMGPHLWRWVPDSTTGLWLRYDLALSASDDAPGSDG